MKLNKLLLLIVMLGMFPGHAMADVTVPEIAPNTDMYITNGPVSATVLSEDSSKVYVGGEFSYVGPNTGHAVKLNEAGVWDETMPRVDGSVSTIISDGAGGWYIGGSFDTVGGFAMDGLAHILADKTVDTTVFGNQAIATSYVYTLALSGTTLYVGGNFTSVHGLSRPRLVAIDTLTGMPSAWVLIPPWYSTPVL